MHDLTRKSRNTCGTSCHTDGPAAVSCIVTEFATSCSLSTASRCTARSVMESNHVVNRHKLYPGNHGTVTSHKLPNGAVVCSPRQRKAAVNRAEEAAEGSRWHGCPQSLVVLMAMSFDACRCMDVDMGTLAPSSAYKRRSICGMRVSDQHVHCAAAAA